MPTPDSDPYASLGGDRRQANRGYPYTSINKVHDFDDAPGQTDGLKLSRWGRKKDTPFGGTFDYTDPNDLTGRFLRPGERWSWWGRIKMRWRQFVGKHSKQPAGWVIVDSDYVEVPTANLMCGKEGEFKISPIEVRTTFPIWDDYGDKALFTVAGYEQLMDERHRLSQDVNPWSSDV